MKQEVQTALLDQIEVNKYPDGAVDEQVKQANDYYTQIAQMYGVELSDFITTYLNMTEDTFNEKIEDSAKQAVQLEEAVKLIAKKEKLEPSDKEYEEGMQQKDVFLTGFQISVKRIMYLQGREKVSADLIKVLINVGTMDARHKARCEAKNSNEKN